jgi:AcrR family transcriptional regulator
MLIHKTYRPHLSKAGDARAVRTRKSLREAMLGLLETKRFDQITIGDIADAANVGYSTVCRHYPTLEALLDDVAAEQIARIINLSFPRFDPNDTRAACIALFTSIDEHRAVWSALLTGGAAGALRQEFLRITRQLALSWKQPQGWLPRDLGVQMTVSGTIELLTWWLEQADPMSIEEIAGIFHRMLVAPMLTNGEPAKAR